MIKFNKWKSCVTDKPTKDGNYLVLRFYRGKCTLAMVTEYTVDYGWNASATSPDTVIDFDDGEDYAAFWTNATYEDDDNEPRPHKIYT